MKFFTKFFFVFGILLFGISAIQAQDYVRLKVNSPDVVDWDIDAIYYNEGGYFNSSLTGELVLAFDAITAPTDGDTWSPVGYYCCDTVLANPEDLAGKIAMIGRGACTFTSKVQIAQNAGAIGMIVMNRAPLGATVGTHTDGLIIMATAGLPLNSIPGIFITYEDGLELMNLVNQGPVNITFEAVPMYDAVGPNAYATPLSQVTPIDSMTVSTFVRGPDTLFNVTFQVEITDPSNNVTTFTELVETLLPGAADSAQAINTLNEPLIHIPGSYTPTEVGEYTMVYSASTLLGDQPIDDEVITKTFEITDYTFALDNGVVKDLNGIQMNQENYELGDAIFNVGSIYRMGTLGGISTYSSFAVANPAALDGLEFTMQLFDADANLDGVLDTDFQLESPVAEGPYTFDGTENPNGLIVVPWSAPATLNGNGIYCVLVNAGAGENFDNPPAYSSAGGDAYLYNNTVVEYNNVFETDGFEYWNDDATTGYGRAGRHPIVRLHMAGFVGVEEIGLLDDNKIKMYPTVTNSNFNVEFNLDNNSDVDVVIADLMGRKVFANTYNNVLNQTLNISVDGFASGTYLIYFTTAEGVISKKFVVAQ